MKSYLFLGVIFCVLLFTIENVIVVTGLMMSL